MGLILLEIGSEGLQSVGYNTHNTHSINIDYGPNALQSHTNRISYSIMIYVMKQVNFLPSCLSLLLSKHGADL